MNFSERFILLIWTIAFFLPLKSQASAQGDIRQPTGMIQAKVLGACPTGDLSWQSSDGDSDHSVSLATPTGSLPDGERPEFFRQNSFESKAVNLSEAWDQYLAGKWLNVFSKLNLKSDAVVIEFAPGTSRKIGLALKKYSFTGKIYLIEPEPESMKIIADKYRKLLPDATVIELECPLDEVLENHPEFGKKVIPDLLVSNHGLDDMISGSYFETYEAMNDFFNDHYPDPHDLEAQKYTAKISARIWENIVKTRQARPLRKKVFKELKNFIQNTGVKNIGLSVYESYFFYKWSDFYPSLNYAYLEARLVMKGLEDWLINHSDPGYKRIRMLDSEVLQSAEMWYVFEIIPPLMSPFETESPPIEAKKTGFSGKVRKAFSKLLGQIWSAFS